MLAMIIVFTAFVLSPSTDEGRVAHVVPYEKAEVIDSPSSIASFR